MRSRLGRALRVQNDLKIRQPLAAVHLVTRDDAERAVLMEMEEILRDELNVKRVVFRDNEDELVEYSAKANFRALGKELGKDMKAVAEAIERLSGSAVASLIDGSVLELSAGAGRSRSRRTRSIFAGPKKRGSRFSTRGA